MSNLKQKFGLILFTTSEESRDVNYVVLCPLLWSGIADECWECIVKVICVGVKVA